MSKSLPIFFVAVLAVVLGIAKCNSSHTQVAQPAASPSPAPAVALASAPAPAATATPVASATPVAQASAAPDFKKAADKVDSAIISIVVFDSSGKLLRNGTGFFVSDDGRFLTSRSIVQGGTNAVAKTKDGGIYNVLGFLADAAPADVSVLKAQVKEKTPFLVPTKAAMTEQGARIAIVGSEENGKDRKLSEATAAAVHRDSHGDWVELPSLPSETLGAPVINENGDVVGIATLQRGQGVATTVARVAAAIDPILAKIESNAKPAWGTEPTPAPPAMGPSPSPKAVTQRKLLFSPIPSYPASARRGYLKTRAAGRYAVRFTSSGEVKDVQVLQSSQNSALDSAAVETLRKWKAAPGQEWTATVPISFQP